MQLDSAERFDPLHGTWEANLRGHGDLRDWTHVDEDEDDETIWWMIVVDDDDDSRIITGTDPRTARSCHPCQPPGPDVQLPLQMVWFMFREDRHLPFARCTTPCLIRTFPQRKLYSLFFFGLTRVAMKKMKKAMITQSGNVDVFLPKCLNV